MQKDIGWSNQIREVDYHMKKKEKKYYGKRRSFIPSF
ncbi:hypothetical protein CLOL250_02473 [Clostridium sp. L2-50]|nr:hypothetical protein CLOL250_02473 [Clostridium sp. L2-50]